MNACRICKGATTRRSQHVRSRKEMELFRCANCNFDFFDIDPIAQLAADKLDQSRLLAAGLDIPAVENDFANGLRQSQPYLKEYLGEPDRGSNVLEVGCSWGYFLKLVKDAGAKAHGLEVNTVRAHYVNAELGIPCYTTLADWESTGIRFKQIFLFYVLEYIPAPIEYLTRLLNMLEGGGQIVIITPNLSDVLKDVWSNEAFGSFFYDEHAVNYFTAHSIRNLVERLPASNASVITRQGYSFVNHLSWYLTNAPRTTGMVGGDYYVRDIGSRLRASAGELGAALGEVLEAFDSQYRKLIEDHDCGNQIHAVLRR